MILETLQLDSGELERRTGWSIKPIGACKGDRCAPLPASRDGQADVQALTEQLHWLAHVQQICAENYYPRVEL